MRGCRALFGLFWLTLFISSSSAAANHNSAEIFSSNNTHEIDLQSAYVRLTGAAQQNLRDKIINTLQKNHIEPHHFENVLGTYRMANDQKITADNTEISEISPRQDFSNAKIFALARQLAVILKQKSVAVFIPQNSQGIADVTLRFASVQPGINDTVAMLHEKLPASYSQAFSLHLASKHGDFSAAKVSEVEWLGSKIQIDEIKKAFPREKISYRDGKAFLVYQNGKTELL